MEGAILNTYLSIVMNAMDEKAQGIAKENHRGDVRYFR
jgi:hypothetical protein